MTPRERIIATLVRRPVDRPPVDLWLTGEALASLLKHTGQTNELALYHHLGVDKIVWTFPDYAPPVNDTNRDENRDPWGVPTITTQSGLATYQEFGAGPLGEFDRPAQLDDYAWWPDPDHFTYATAKRKAEQARSHDFATIGPWVSLFETYCHMRGMENALMDVIAEPEFLEAALDRIERIQTRMLEHYLDTLGPLADLVFISDDLGTQESKLISVPAFTRFLKPRIKRWVDLVHERGKRVLFHTDGAARDFIPHLIECGIDLLNPIQHVCPGMDVAALKRDFGRRLTFHGGIDNQQVLPFGTVDEVRQEVETCLESLGAGGGYIPCSCHNVQAGTPPENIIALVETVHGWSR